jgi:hypothetical protein
MGIWNHIIFEAFCCFSWESKKQWKMYSYDFKAKAKDFLRTKGKPIIRVNENYISPSCRPKWCVKRNKKFVPQFLCFCHRESRCPFLAFTEATSKDKRIMFEAWHKANK